MAPGVSQQTRFNYTVTVNCVRLLTLCRLPFVGIKLLGLHHCVPTVKMLHWSLLPANHDLGCPMHVNKTAKSVMRGILQCSGVPYMVLAPHKAALRRSQRNRGL